MIKIAILRPQALRALPRITNTEIKLASSTSLGSGSTQLFTPGSWVLNNNRLQNCITLEDTVMRPRCASWMTGTTVGLDILQLAYMDHTMGMVIILPRVKTNPL